MTDTLTSFPAMPYLDETEVFPVTRITAGAVGTLGQRVFILQVHIGSEPVTWIIEKDQALGLSRRIPALLADVRSSFPELNEPLVAEQPNLELSEPLQPLFRVGSIGVGYDRAHDLVVFTLIDIDVLEGRSEGPNEGPNEQYVCTTRGQALLLAQQAERVVAAGRPYCPTCGEPIDDFGHFCLPAGVRSRRGGEYLH